MIRPLAGTALALAFGGVAEAQVQNLVPEFQEACRPASVDAGVPGDYGLIKAEAVRDAMFKAFPVSPSLMMQGPDVLVERAMKPPPGAGEPRASDDDRQLRRYRRMVETWSETPSASPAAPPLAQGGLRFEPTGSAEDVRVRLTRLFRADESLRIICRNPTPERAESPDHSGGDEGEEKSVGPELVLVKAADDLAEAELGERTFAEFSYSNNQESGVEAWAVQFAAGLRWPEQPPGGGALKWTPLVYVAYDRQGGDDPAADGYVNNLDFGAQIDGHITLGGAETWQGYFAFSGVYQTDDDFESEAHALKLVVDPPLPYIRYHRGYQPVVGGPVEIELKWNADLVGDWVQVRDAGHRQAWVDRAEYARLGYDVGFDLRFGPAQDDWRLVLSADYGLRDGQTGDGGDAQMFNAGLLFIGSDETNWAFGLSYERGENLQSFEKSELWKLVFGVRL